MSNYFRVLKRLDADRHAEPAPPPQHSRVTIAPRKPVCEAPADSGLERESIAQPDVASAYALLYDNLRATANGEAIRTLVFAGASPSDSPSTVTAGLAAHVRWLGLRVLIAQLEQSSRGPLLHIRQDGMEPATQPASLPLDLRSHADTVELGTWLRENTRDADLVLIEGLGLSESLEPALVACASDGLVIVARMGSTPRVALQVAVERARAVGCRFLGIVTQGGADGMPGWLRRLVVHSQKPHASPEKR